MTCFAGMIMSRGDDNGCLTIELVILKKYNDLMRDVLNCGVQVYMIHHLIVIPANAGDLSCLLLNVNFFDFNSNYIGYNRLFFFKLYYLI